MLTIEHWKNMGKPAKIEALYSAHKQNEIMIDRLSKQLLDIASILSAITTPVTQSTPALTLITEPTDPDGKCELKYREGVCKHCLENADCDTPEPTQFSQGRVAEPAEPTMAEKVSAAHNAVEASNVTEPAPENDVFGEDDIDLDGEPIPKSLDQGSHPNDGSDIEL